MQNYEHFLQMYSDVDEMPVDPNLVELCRLRAFQLVQLKVVLRQFKYLQRRKQFDESFCIFKEYLGEIVSKEFVEKLEVI